MRKEVKRMYDLFLNTLTLKELQTIYEESLSDLEETEYLHSSILGLTKSQRNYYKDLKEDLSIYSILEQRSEQMVFNKVSGKSHPPLGGWDESEQSQIILLFL